MNTNEPRIRNDLPIETISQLPRHRLSVCPNTWIIGMSHQSILTFINEIVNGEFVPISSAWFRDLVDEAIYRGLIFQTTNGMNNRCYQEWYNSEQFMNCFSIREGFSFMQQKEHK